MDLRCGKCSMLYLNVERIPGMRQNGACPKCHTGTLRDTAGPPPIPPRQLVKPLALVKPPAAALPVAVKPLGLGALASQAVLAKGGLKVATDGTAQINQSKQVYHDLTQTMGGQAQPWHAAFDLWCSRSDFSIIVTIRIKTVAGTAVPSETVKQNWSSKISRDWQGYQLIDDTRQAWRLGIKIDWVDSGEHYTVTCNRGISQHGTVADDGTEHVFSWGDLDGAGGPDDVSAISHEVGHMIGNCDQYGNITAFTGRASGIQNYGAPVEISTKRKAFAKDQGGYVNVAGPRKFFGVKNQGIMGNVVEPPKPVNWYLVGREFARLMDRAKPVSRMKIVDTSSKAEYTIEAH